MNKLKTDINGGMPLELDDIRWEQAAVREAFYGLISAFGITAPLSFKLSGCDVSITGGGADYACAAGYICLEGEVCAVDSHSVTINPVNQMAVFQLEVTYDPSGEETFEDTSVNDTYEIRKAKLVAVTLASPNPYMPYNAPYLSGVIIGQINAEETAWNLVGDTGQPSFETDWSNVGSPDAVCAFKKDAFNVVWMKGVAGHATTGHGRLFTLPAGYRPQEELSFISAYHSHIAVFAVKTDGDVWIYTTNQEYISITCSFKIN